MSGDTMQFWDALARPPASALKAISGGRLKGKSDIKPQWRYKAMTELFGPVGVGWSYTIDRLWTEPGAGGEVFAFALVSVRVSVGANEEWSEPIPGVGGSMLIQAEKNGLYNNDEGFKMAVTDALGTALKTLGVAAEVHMGNWDGSKYRSDPDDEERRAGKTNGNPEGPITEEQAEELGRLIEERIQGPVKYMNKFVSQVCGFPVENVRNIPAKFYPKIAVDLMNRPKKGVAT